MFKILKELLKNKELMFKIKNKIILDVVVFGSAIKGKEKPNDLDILILYKDKVDTELNYIIKNTIKDFKVQIISKTYKELFKEDFLAREAFLGEGYSLVNNKLISKGLGYESLVLFKYNLKGFPNSRRMLFYYALYGRNKSKGILNKLNSIKFSDTVFLVPIENKEKFKEFLDYWKIQYIEFQILLPLRIVESDIFKNSRFA
ncbi:MAG: nucleotidyltransferase domain-containing protein [Nanoarchaeota archaeon]|nr:nucleotidyltransferase domain-containing protein [Nanoarchaeota archaeon]